MSFTAKLSVVAKSADAIEFDGQEVYQWCPDGAGGLLIEYGDDIEYPERIRIKDQDVLVDNDGLADVQGPDPDAQDDLDLDDPEPTKAYKMEFLVHRPISEGDLTCA